MSRELVAAEAWYHRSCYREYTRPPNETSTVNTTGAASEEETEDLRNEAFEELFAYIRSDLLKNPRLISMVELKEMLLSFKRAKVISSEAPAKNLKRKLKAEFGEVLQFEDLLDNNKLIIIQSTLSKVHLAKECLELTKQLEKKSSSSDAKIKETGLSIREAVRNHKIESHWPPKPSDFCENAVSLPEKLETFLYILLTGNPQPPVEYPLRIQRLVNSFGQDIGYAVTAGNQKPPKQVLLPYAVKTLTNNVELIQLLNRCGHGIAYSQIEEINTALCMEKLAQTPDNDVPLPESIQPHINTTLAWDNIDRLEETFSGAGTSHRVNGIAVQERHFGPFPKPKANMEISKTKRRSIDYLPRTEVTPYNAGERHGPPSRA